MRRAGARRSGQGRARERPAWLRWKVVLPLLAGALVLLLLQQVFLTDEPVDLIGSGLPSYGAEWSTVDGSSYRLTVVPSSETLAGDSPDGCYERPATGRANLGFAVRVDNLSDGPAPMPDITFAVNATSDGQLDTSPESLSGANRQIEITPRADGASCDDASAIRPSGRARLKAGESATFHGVVGAIASPAPSGLALIIRYIQGDTLHPTVASTADILAPFPPAPKK